MIIISKLLQTTKKIESFFKKFELKQVEYVWQRKKFWVFLKISPFASSFLHFWGWPISRFDPTAEEMAAPPLIVGGGDLREAVVQRRNTAPNAF